MGRAKDLIGSNATRNGQHENLRVIKTKLEQNSLVELRLGFEDGEFRSARDVQSLIQVIEEKFHHQLSLHKHSCLKHVSIGWRLPKFALGPILQSVVPALLQEPVKITHIQLILNDNPPIPKECLERILSWHSLASIDLRHITLRVLAAKPSGEQLKSPEQLDMHRNHLLKGQRKQQFGNTRANNIKSKVGVEESKNWKQENIVNILPHISSSIKTLKLISCGINKYHIPKLCEFIQRRMHRLQKLSLRQNFTLDGGYHSLLSLRGIKCLDLSLCDLDESDGYCIVLALEKFENKKLEQLCLAGNYRLSSSISEIIRAGADKLSHVDCSFCGVNKKTQKEIFDILAEESSSLLLPLSPLSNCKTCTIQSLRMQGVILNDVEGLVKCIRNNSFLRSLIIDHPHEIRSISLEDMRKIVAALRSNYSLEILKIDFTPTQYPDSFSDFEFWLKLNRCGRRALLLQKDGEVKSWLAIIAKAAKSNDHNILYWLLKHGSFTFT